MQFYIKIKLGLYRSESTTEPALSVPGEGVFGALAQSQAASLAGSQIGSEQWKKWPSRIFDMRQRRARSRCTTLTAPRDFHGPPEKRRRAFPSLSENVRLYATRDTKPIDSKEIESFSSHTPFSLEQHNSYKSVSINLG